MLEIENSVIKKLTIAEFQNQFPREIFQSDGNFICYTWRFENAMSMGHRYQLVKIYNYPTVKH